MSSYQLYEFQALDRVLSKADKTYLNSLSSRAEVTATSARYTYSYSDFRTKPLDVLERCFDIMLYQASYGVCQLAIRLPKALASLSHYEPYCLPYLITQQLTEKSVILNISINATVFGGWLSEEGRLPELIDIHSELLQGDLRVLYLAWLSAAYSEDCSYDWETTIEPPIPPNLKSLSPALEQFADIFEVDSDLIAAAATESKTISTSSAPEPLDTWIAALSEAERNHYLLRVAKGEANVGFELMQHLRQQFGQDPTIPASQPGVRTFTQLETASHEVAKRQAAQAQAAAEKAEQQRIAALIPKVDKLWELVVHLVERGQAKTYDEAVAHLKDLQAISQSQNTSAAFHNRLQTIKEDFSRKHSFIARLKQAKL